MIKSLKKYRSVFLTSFKQSYNNKPMISGLVFLLLLLILVYNQLWIVIGKEEGSNINTYFIWYLLFGEIIILSPPRIDKILDEDIKTGIMAYYINKPISFFLMRFVEALGGMSAVFIYLFFIGGIVTYALTFSTPFSLYHFPILILVCYISAAINTFFKSIIGLCAIWLNTTRPLHMIVERMAFIFGGAIFPLTIYPQWFIDIAKYTPFYSFYYLSIRLVYDFSWSGLILAVCMNIFWVAVISVFVSIAYKNLSKRINIYGG